ncbi:MAG TPA: hypothetical protein VLC93_08190 [Myxococcota bacterium]|nr:hypothetical protein [Myxococcota bacterium]
MIIACATLTGIYLLWLLIATWFVRDGLKRINSAQPYVTFTMGAAVSWWPGRLSGTDLHVVIHDTDVELDMHFDRFALDVELRPLANLRFVTHATRLDGVSFYFRQTRKVPELCKHPSLPPITGQASANAPDCLAQKETALPPQGGGPEGIWRLHLGGIELTDVRDVWVEYVRFRGKGGVSGRMYLWPTQELDLASESAHWDDMTVTLGAEQPLALVKSVDVATVMRDMEVPKHRIWEEIVSADIVASGAMLQLARLGAGGVAKTDLEAHMRDGLVSGVTARAHSNDFFLPLAGKKLAGVLDTHVRIDGEQRSLRIHEARATLKHVKVDDERFADAELALSALPGGRIDPKNGRGRFELVASGKSAKPVLALMPPTFGAAIAKLAVGPDAEIHGAAKVEATLPKLVAEPFTVQGGSLDIAGRMVLTPTMSGTMVARVGPIAKNIEVK